MKAAQDINLHNDQHPGLPPKRVLLEWSKKIKSDVATRSRIEKVRAMDPDGSADQSLLAEMADDIKVLKQNNNDVVLEVATQTAIIIAQEMTINDQKSIMEKQAAEIAKLSAANGELKEQERRVRESISAMKRQMPDTPQLQHHHRQSTTVLMQLNCLL